MLRVYLGHVRPRLLPLAGCPPVSSGRVERCALRSPRSARGSRVRQRAPGRHPVGDVTLLFSLRENAIAKEPGLGYSERWRCVSRLGLFNGGLDSLASSPYVTLSRGAFSAPSLVTPS